MRITIDKRVRSLIVSIISVFLLFFAACGGAEEPTVTPPVIGQITPDGATVQPVVIEVDTPTPTELLPTNTPDVSSYPDLALTYSEIGIFGSPICLLPDTNLASGLTISISNGGGGNAGEFVVDIEGITERVDGLAAGESVQLFFDDISGGPFVVSIDSQNQVEESNEENNITTEQPPIPTLPAPCTPTPAPLGQPLNSINFEYVTDGLTRPVFLTHADDSRLFVVQQPGQIIIVDDADVLATPFLDIADRVNDQGNEQGLLGLAFHPDYGSNGRFFINYTHADGSTVVSEFRVTDDPYVADPASERQLLKIPQPYRNHNGGGVVFGPDGYLYIGMGDGGSQNDPENRAQDLQSLLGKILRIDVNQGDPYGIPADNPFVGNESARNEIWSLGWRNPWRFSFDPVTNDMFIGDVGQNVWEEISFQPADVGGLNYGWRIFEGSTCYLDDCNTPNLVPPIGEYDHSGGHCSITGGYIYRGSRHPDLYGNYIFSDFCSGQIWRLFQNLDGSWDQAEIGEIEINVASFGVDVDGEIYVLGLDGSVFRVTP